jgi:hypothetical protein
LFDTNTSDTETVGTVNGYIDWLEEVSEENKILTKDDFFFNSNDNVWQAYIILDHRFSNDTFFFFRAQDESWFFNVPDGIGGDIRFVGGTNLPGLNNQFPFAVAALRVNDEPTFTETYPYKVNYAVPNWNLTFTTSESDLTITSDVEPQANFDAILLVDADPGTTTVRRILQSDLDKYEAAFTFADTFELDLPDGIVSTIDDLSTAGETDEVRISTQPLSIDTELDETENQ